MSEAAEAEAAYTLYILAAGHDVYLFRDRHLYDGQAVVCIGANLDVERYIRRGMTDTAKQDLIARLKDLDDPPTVHDYTALGSAEGDDRPESAAGPAETG